MKDEQGSNWRIASVLIWIVALQLARVVLPPRITSWHDIFWIYMPAATFGAMFAPPALLAIWAVFGPQRATRRLPLTLFIMAAFAECVAFGAVLEQAPTNAQVLTLGFALLIAFVAMQIALWPLRALRGWRLLAPLEEGCLRDLTLRGTNLTDVGLVELGRFERLEVLDLTNTQITDDGLRHLKPLAHLRELHLMLTETTDAGLVPLGQLPSLELLDVTLTAVSGGGANQFRQAHPRIRTGAGTSDLQLSTVLSSPKFIDAAHPVTSLHACGHHVTDSYLSVFSRLADLEHLDLRGTAVTDRGARTLAALKTLRRLDLRGSAISPKGTSRLTKSLPDCEIVH